MSYLFTVSPDFSPDHLSGWYIFNTWLQRQTGTAIHLELYDNFQAQRAAIQANQVDLIYANPFDAAMLVREKNFFPLVKAEGVSDEAVIVVSADNPINDIAQLSTGIKVAVTEDPDVHMIGMIMLEPADLDANNIETRFYNNQVLIVKSLLQGKTDVGILLAKAYDDLSNLTKNHLKVLVRSQISVIHHSLMLGTKLADRRDEIQNLLLAMNHDDKGKSVLNSLGFEAWNKVDDEEMEFMIDLMDTLII
jgi:phosphonate transport system substrate-binding protein